MFGESEDGSFEFNELGLNFSTDLSDNLRLGTQLFARDLGEEGNDEVNVDWAFADYRWRDYLGLRVGKMKMAHGLYNETRDIDAVRTNASLPGSVYVEQLRDLLVGIRGAGVYGEVPGGVSYTASYGTIDLQEDSFIITLFAETLGLAGSNISSVSVEYARNASIQWEPPVEGLKFGLSHFGAKFDMVSSTVGAIEFKNMSTNVGSIEYTFGDLVIAGEYAIYNIEAENSALAPTISGLYTAAGISPHSGNTIIDRDSEAYYGSVSYRLTDWFEIGAYYSMFYIDKDDKDGDDAVALAAAQGSTLDDHSVWQQDTTVSGRFDINESWILKAETHFMNGTYFSLDRDATGAEEDWVFSVIKATFSF